MTDFAEIHELHALVHGRVQGVAFRAFVRQAAVALGLKGWVRNLADGATVEVVAQGPNPALSQLLEALRRGPPLARVERVEERWDGPAKRFTSFEVH